MRDFLPAQMRRRQSVLGVIQKHFKRYGFEELVTPSLEKRETLLGKYGEDANPLIYHARHERGKEELSLRYDLTVPLARVVAMHGNELPLPFKRYQIAPVWRAERPQRGRYREFYQCDADTVGSAAMAADAELIAMLCEILRELGFDGERGPSFKVHINNRKLLHGIGEYAEVPKDLLPELYRSLDKFERIGRDGVREELTRRGITSVDFLLGLLELSEDGGSGHGALKALDEELANIPSAREGIAELWELDALLREYALDDANYRFDFTMVRGLGYYTGPIYEAIISEPNLGSISGGGRYDRLIGIFQRESLPTTGLSIGIERILDLMDILNLFPQDIAASGVQALIAYYEKEQLSAAIRFASELREQNIAVELSYEMGKLARIFRRANRKGIPLVVIFGPTELEQGIVYGKRLADGDEQRWPREAAAAGIAAYLASPIDND